MIGEAKVFFLVVGPLIVLLAPECGRVVKRVSASNLWKYALESLTRIMSGGRNQSTILTGSA